MPSLLASPARPGGAALPLGQIATFNPPSPPNYQPPNPGTFTGAAPTPTAYGAFTAPDPATYAMSPAGQYLLGQQQKAIQRSGAARGSLLTGGLLNRLQENASGIAAQDYGNAFTRALQSYTANRDTNAQNFNQQLGSFGAGLDAFKANAGTTLDYGRLGLESTYGNYDRAYQAAEDQQGYQQAINDRNAFFSSLRPGPAQFGGTLSSPEQHMPQVQTGPRPLFGVPRQPVMSGQRRLM